MTQTLSRRLTMWLAAASLSAATLAAAGQQPNVVVDDDEITIRGCVGRMSPGPASERMLVWTRGDIMLSNPNALRSGQLAERVFYWLEDDEAQFAMHHTVAGNPMRFKRGRIRLRVDDAWKTKLSKVHQLAITCITWPLLRHYRYPARVRRES